MVDINTEYLIKLKKNIEILDECHHNKILEIVQNHDIKFSENRNGIFVNMNLFDKNIIFDIIKYLNYVKEQEKTLNDIESLKLDFKKNYFNKQDKEKLVYSTNE